ncbi:hypothetical protein I551_5067 [Mycobacterium ulcerans str. Harvey]|uniref:Uncharacterized protein n=1 Tax=Mycobacterium ulcerans str. Harvey TaxID=1299332 RepID=A0ABN0QUS2_MYCUL|nr:hypothetical protein I551_5067 [Mycobacterium ulcerans str. Harvey]
MPAMIDRQHPPCVRQTSQLMAEDLCGERPAGQQRQGRALAGRRVADHGAVVADGFSHFDPVGLRSGFHRLRP